MKVLIVDDEAIVRRSLRRALEARGHSVNEAVDGEAALECWNDFGPDVVFLDVLMPKLNGPQVLARLSHPVGKVILMSAYSGDYDIDKARSLGAELFIEKPFADIFEVVKKAEQLVGAL